MGRWGERVAARHLRQHGCIILGRNVELKDGELDLVAETRGGLLLVVEVKAGGLYRGVGPERRIDHAKREQLLRLARELLRVKRWKGRPFRVDAISVTGRPPQPRVLEPLLQKPLLLPDRWPPAWQKVRPRVRWFRGIACSTAPDPAETSGP